MKKELASLEGGAIVVVVATMESCEFSLRVSMLERRPKNMKVLKQRAILKNYASKYAYNIIIAIRS